MASAPRGVVDIEALILEELRSELPGRGHMRAIFEEIIDLRRGTVLGHEVLTRVNVPRIKQIERRMRRLDRNKDSKPTMRVSPEMWFAKARMLGVVASLEARAVKLALANLPDGDGWLTVNFSPDCLLADEVQAVLDKLADLDRVTVVELAEHHHVGSVELIAALASIRERGILVAVDDAGTGESGPEFVAEVEPDIIKIDRTHVSQLHRNPSQRCFVHRYAELADERESMLVTEGVSSSRIVDALTELGAKWGRDFLGQGYWLSHRRTADAV